MNKELLSQHLNVGGWNFTFTAILIVTAMHVLWVAYHENRKPLPNIDAIRMMIAFSCVCFGGAIRVGGWLPWRAFLYAEEQSLADAYRDYSAIWTSTGIGLACLGLALLMQPYWGWWRSLTLCVIFYIVGYFGTMSADIYLH